MPEKTLKAENGEIVLTFDDIAAMERLRRQPAFSVIKNNIILGGSTVKSNVIRNIASKYVGFVSGLTMEEDNYLEFYYDKVMVDAENYDYTITDEAWATIEAEIGVSQASILKDIDYTRAGLTD